MPVPPKSAHLRWKGGSAIVLALALSACASVPDMGSAVPVKPAESYAAGRALAAAPVADWPQAQWWTAYGDAQLDALIAEALTGSPDLAAAVARVKRADAYAMQAGAARLPTVSASASPAVAKQSYNNGIPADFVPQGWNSTGSISTSIGFDLDLWGKNRAAYAAAVSDADAARLELEQARLVIATGVADAYAELARLHATRDVQQAALALREQTLKLVDRRVRTGLDTQAELKQASAAIPAARADLASTDESLVLTRNRIAALLGQGPDRGMAITRPAAAVAARGIPADATTDLIARRPDVIAALSRVEAEAQRIKVARAGFYPSVNLSAVVGLQSLGLGNLFDGGSTFGNVGPAVSLPVFGAGRIEGGYRAAYATYDEAVAAYDRTVTDAYRALADAVAGQQSLAVQLGEARASLADLQEAQRIAQLRYDGGLSTFLEVITAQDRALQARQLVTALEARAFTLDIALVRALGGGFSAPQSTLNTDISKEKSHG